MARKAKELRGKTIEAAEKFKEMERLLKEAEEEEKKRLEEVEKQIQDVAALNGMFCGVKITNQDLLNIIQLALETKDTISIPFKLYYNE